MRKLLTLMAMLLLLKTATFAQTREIKGTVKDEKGQPVPFATITDANNKRGVQADANGNFMIKTDLKSRLIISASGFNAETVSITGDNMVISLVINNNSMQEVVVTTAMGVKKQKRELGYATSQLSSQELTKSKPVSIASGLSGKVAGLLVVQPNSSVTNDFRIVLRGNRSLTGNNQPILVLDGSVVSISYLNSINPNDIENVTVLKGAASSALYGNEAANGAIILTTKKGARNKAVINFSSTTTMETVSRMPKLQNSFGSYGGEGEDQYGHDPYIPYENQSFGPRFNGQMLPIGNPVRIFRADGSYFDSALTLPYIGRANEKRKFFNNSMTYQNDISFSSGDATSMFYLSAQDLRRNGIVPNDQLRRNTIRMNAAKEIDRLTLGFNMGYTRSSSDVVGIDPVSGRAIYWSVMNAPAGIPLTSLKDVVNNPFATPSGYFNAYYGNPYWAIQNARDKNIADNILGNLNLSFKATDWLTAQYRLTYNATFDSYESHVNSMAFTDWGKAYAKSGFDNYPGSGGYKSSDYPGGINQSGYLEKSMNSRIQSDVFLNFNHEFGKFSTKLILGNSFYQISGNQNYTGATNIDPVTGIPLSINSYDNLNVWGPAYVVGQPLSYKNESMVRTIGAFGDLTIGYNNYLFAHGSLRNDWDSRLEPNHRSFIYPAGDISLVFTDAISAFKNVSFLSSGKLRLSYAKVGLLQVGPYSTRDAYPSATGLGFPYTSSSGTPIFGYQLGGTFNNLNLKPEFTTEKEVGLELSWLKNRLLSDFSFFKQSSTDQTLSVNVSSASGRNNLLQNIGSVENTGFEGELRGVILENKKLHWTIGINYSYINNKVLEIAPGVDQLLLNGSTTGLGGGIYAIKGQQYPVLKTTDWQRDDQGRIIVDAITGLPKIDPNLKSFGTTQPPTRLGINTSLNIGRFTIYALAEYRSGAVLLNAVGTDFDFTGSSTNTTQFNRDKFVIPNSSYYDGSKYVANTNVLTNTDSWNFWANVYNKVGSNYVTSADFWKLREVSIAYELPSEFIQKSKVFKAATLSLVGRDLLIITSKENIWTDPEFSNSSGNGQGITDRVQTPTTRKFGLNLNITF